MAPPSLCWSSLVEWLSLFLPKWLEESCERTFSQELREMYTYKCKKENGWRTHRTNAGAIASRRRANNRVDRDIFFSFSCRSTCPSTRTMYVSVYISHIFYIYTVMQTHRYGQDEAWTGFANEWITFFSIFFFFFFFIIIIIPLFVEYMRTSCGHKLAHISLRLDWDELNNRLQCCTIINEWKENGEDNRLIIDSFFPSQWLSIQTYVVCSPTACIFDDQMDQTNGMEFFVFFFLLIISVQHVDW